MSSYIPSADRYETMPFRRCGRSGVQLPLFSLGFHQNFGENRAIEQQRAIVRRAFDVGITHFDLANNYGPPYGAAESILGTFLASDFNAHRDELLISTKAGFDMWPGPYGNWGSRKYLLTSLNRSLTRLGLDYVDVFYSHRYDPDTPLEETMGALSTAVQSGRALYVGISSYPPEATREAAELLARMSTPLLIHQPRYSLLQRTMETDLLPVLAEAGVGCIAFSVLAQGVLTDKYANDVPADSRLARTGVAGSQLTDENKVRVRALAKLAADRGQSLAQMALAWATRDERVSSVLLGTSSLTQLEDNLAVLNRLDFASEELAAIDAATSN